jgi:hypothetical protein
VRVIAGLGEIHYARGFHRLILETELTPFGDVLRQRLIFDKVYS